MLDSATSLRSRAKRLLLRLPFRRQLFVALRKVWTPPAGVRRYLYFHGPFRVPVAGTSFVMINHALDVETSIFWTGVTGSWEKRSLAVWIELCRDATVIVDAGANTGVYSLVASALNPSARVYSFEPVARVHAKLLENVAANGYDIRCRALALSNYDGEGVIYDLPIEHIYTVTVNRNTFPADWPVKPITIATKRLDTVIEEERLDRLDLMKIDVESHEPEVLEGLGRYLRQMQPTLLVEIWSDEVGMRVEALVEGLGYLYFSTDEDRPFAPARHIRHPRGPAAGYMTYLLCSPGVAQRLFPEAAVEYDDMRGGRP